MWWWLLWTLVRAISLKVGPEGWMEGPAAMTADRLVAARIGKTLWLVTLWGRWEARSAIEVTIEPMEPSSAERGCWGSKTLEEREKGAVIRDR